MLFASLGDDVYVTVRVAAPLPPLTYKCAADKAASGAPALASVGSRLIAGYIEEIGVTPPANVKTIKYVSPIADLPQWGEGFRVFLRKLSRYYFVEEGRAIAGAFPHISLLSPKPRIVKYVSLKETGAEKLTDKQRRVVNALQQNDEPLARLCELADCGQDVVKRMEKKGLLALYEKEEQDAPEPSRSPLVPELSASQQEAVNALASRCAPDAKFSADVIKGVTGSGKTEVFFALVEESLRQNPHGQCLLLSPEIALTTQMIERVYKRFGVMPAVWHHGLTPAARRRNWRSVCRGEARIVVGARSALLLPYANLRMIIVDEEHENSYKQEDGLCYHARDMAILRASCENFPVYLASATPSLETLHNVNAGKYGMVELPKRYGAAAMPQVRVVGMKGRKKPKSRWLADEVIDAIASALNRSEQALLFVNRRGYAPLALCGACGHVYECDACADKMSYHKNKDCLLCHHCGRQKKLPDICPECEKEGSTALCGPGVERLTAEAKKLFPAARILCLSGDATNDFTQAASGDFDILVGTQIIAKGLHFPHLTVVCVADGDMGLYGADPRAREKCFQLIRQVSGRAGRADKPGTVFLQSFDPGHPLFAMLADEDDAPFVQNELSEREAAEMPPFARMAMAHFSSKDEPAAYEAARRFIAGVPKDGLTIWGPAPAPIKRIKYAYRVRVALKSPSAKALSYAVTTGMATYKGDSRVDVKIDRDPVAL